MESQEILQEVEKLDVDQRLLLVEAIWDSLSSEESELPIQDWQLEKLGHRQFDPSLAQPWSELRKKMGLH